MTSKTPVRELTVQTVEVSHAQQYGKDRYYPENEAARVFVKLLKQESLSPRDIQLIKELGFKVVLRPKSIAPTEL